MKDFKEKVLGIVRSIKKGETETYAEVARLAGNSRAARAVGSIMARNFDPQTPCHRVIKSDGSLGSYNRGGVLKKRALLRKEGLPAGRQVQFDKKFFNRKTLTVAKELLGKYLVRRLGRKIIREKITEVEAYVGAHDLASHSSHGRSKRNEPMYSKAGTIYVYFTYGMHWMLNIVTEEKDYPAAVLIRGTEHQKGPAILTRALKIDKKLNGKMLGKKSGLWIENGTKPKKINRTPRIGIHYAGSVWAAKKYRFVLSDN